MAESGQQRLRRSAFKFLMCGRMSRHVGKLVSSLPSLPHAHSPSSKDASMSSLMPFLFCLLVPRASIPAGCETHAHMRTHTHVRHRWDPLPHTHKMPCMHGFGKANIPKYIHAQEKSLTSPRNPRLSPMHAGNPPFVMLLVTSGRHWQGQVTD